MDIVIDTSAIVAVVAGEPERDWLVEVTRGANLLAPQSVLWEVGNAFSAMLRRQRTTLPAVLMAIAAFQQIPLRLVEVELDESLCLAAQFGIYAYDAYLIRCAIKYGAALLSLDDGLNRWAHQAQVQTIEVPR